jgi:ABC-type multidrug transport system ATPase subunit
MQDERLVCQYGDINPYNPATCLCQSGWGGMKCDMCENDVVCSDDDEKVCDRNIFPGVGKIYECKTSSDEIVDLVGDTLVLELLKFEENDEIVGFAEFWGEQLDDDGETIITHKTFECLLYDINATYNYDTSEVSVTSDRSGCLCSKGSKKCCRPDEVADCEDKDGMISFVVENMMANSEIVCDAYTRACKLIHQNFPGVIPLVCSAAGCLDEAVPFPSNFTYQSSILILSWQGYVVDGLAVVFVIILCFCLPISCCCYEFVYRYKVRVVDTKIIKDIHTYFVDVVINKYTISKKDILQRINIEIGPGITGIFGPSGAGKTTFLNIVAGHKMKGKLGPKSKISYNDINIKNINLSKIRGFQEQEVELSANSKVIEEIRFSASSRNIYKKNERSKLVEETIHGLGLGTLRNEKIGSEKNHILSGGEKKRVKIGAEIVSSQPILLLDEPLSGLNPSSAIDVLNELKKRNKYGYVTMLTVHGPTDEMFMYFDRIIFIKEGFVYVNTHRGNVIEALENFRDEEADYGWKPQTEDAGNEIEITNDDDDDDEEEDERKDKRITPRIKRKESKFFAKISKTYGELLEDNLKKVDSYARTQKEIKTKDSYMFVNKMIKEEKDVQPTRKLFVKNYEKREGKKIDSVMMSDDITEDINLGNFLKKSDIMRLQATNRTVCEQFWSLSIRDIRETLRYPWSFIAQLLLTLAASVFISVLYFKLDLGISGSQNRMGFIFWVCSYLSLIGMNSLWLFSEDKLQYCQEVFNGYYTLDAWFFQKVVSKFLSNSLIQPFIISVTTYWMIGLHPGRFVVFLFIVTCISILSDMQGVIIGVIAQDKKKLGIVMFTLLFLFNGLTCGLLLSIESVPPILQWFGYFGFWKVGYEALMVTEYSGLTVTLDPKGMPPYPVPGEFWLNNIGMDVNNYDFDLAMLVLLITINVTVGYFLFKCLMKIKK